MERSSFDINWTYDYYIDTVYYGQLDSLINSGQIDTVYSDDELYNGRLINYVQDTVNNNTHIRKYVEECGLALERYYNLSLITGSYVEELFYFKKGDEEWGSPMYVSVEELTITHNISIYPTPHLPI